MPEVVVFLGPSLRREDAERVLSADYRPPAARGDIPRAVADGARVIGLIDGVFFQECSVGHREILSAIKRGITVIGASSMGALRASELDTLGMKGVGEIYRRYSCGEIIADDEVALIYDPETYAPLSVPLINIRYTIERGIADMVISQETGEILLKSASSLYFPERTYRKILSIAQPCISDYQLDRFREYTKNGGEDLKRIDAIAALMAVRDCIPVVR